MKKVLLVVGIVILIIIGILGVKLIIENRKTIEVPTGESHDIVIDSIEFFSSSIDNTELTREYLARNDVTYLGSSTFAPCPNACIDFIEKNYKLYSPSNIKVNFINGGTIKKGVISDSMEIHVGSYNVDFNTEEIIEELESTEDKKYTIKLQVIMGSKNDDSYYRLLGFVTNQDEHLIKNSQVVDFLKDYFDVRYYVPNVDENLEVINISNLFNNEKIFFNENNSSSIGIVSVDRNYRLKEKTGYGYGIYFTELDLTNFNMSEKKTLTKEATGSLTLALDEIYEKYFPEKANYDKKHELLENVYIVEKDCSLYLEQGGNERLLLKGIDVDHNGLEGYNFIQKIDADRFIFNKYGYEWTAGTGIYNIKTDEVIFFEDLYCSSVEGSKILLSEPYEESSYIYDLVLGKIYNTDLTGVAYFFPGGEKILIESDKYNYRDIEVYDTSTLEKLYSTRIEQIAFTVSKAIFLESELCLIATGHSFGADYIFKLNYSQIAKPTLKNGSKESLKLDNWVVENGELVNITELENDIDSDLLNNNASKLYKVTYMEKVKTLNAELSEKYDSITYDLAYVDKDDIPELIVYASNYDEKDGESGEQLIYTYQDGNVKELVFEGYVAVMGGDKLLYSPKKNRICLSETRPIVTFNHYYILSSEKNFERLYSICTKTWSEEESMYIDGCTYTDADGVTYGITDSEYTELNLKSDGSFVTLCGDDMIEYSECIALFSKIL